MSDREPRIHCTRCGECCRGFSADKHVLLFAEDLRTIPAQMQMDGEEFRRRYCNREILQTSRKAIPVHSLKYVRGECVFLDNNICSIYPFRPIQCQRAPLHFFWNGSFDYDYPCQQDVEVPTDWSSATEDRQLMASLVDSEKT